MCLTWVTFGLQLFRVGYVLTLHGVLASLAYICNLGPGVVYLAQELVYAMGNATMNSRGAPLYAPYSEKPYGKHYASSPYIDVGDMVLNFNFMEYCKDTDASRDAAAGSVLYGCFMTLFRQALMAMALNAEKARIRVHDLHEQEHTLMGVAAQLGNQAHHTFDNMPLPSQMQQALTGPWSLASSLYNFGSGLTGHP